MGHGHQADHTTTPVPSWPWRVWPSAPQQRQVHRCCITRTLAESVLLSEISKHLRDLNVDIDGTADEWYRQNNQTPPHKVHEATNQDTQQATTDAAHQLQELQEEGAKYKQKLPEAGIDVTPASKRKATTTLEDNLSMQDDDEEEAPTSSQKKIKVDPKPKRRRSVKAKDESKDNSKDNLSTWPGSSHSHSASSSRMTTSSPP